jgi:hypothetical protein
MSGFIEITDKNKCRRLLNVRHIEEVAENITKDGCYIYLAFNTPNATEQDYFEVAESYEAIIDKISNAVILNAYAMVQGGY